MKLVHTVLAAMFVFSLGLLTAQTAHAILIGVPIVAISLVKIIAVLLGILAVPTSIITQVIKKDVKKTVVYTMLTLISAGVLLFVAFSLLSTSQEVSFLDVSYDKVAQSEIMAEPQLIPGAANLSAPILVEDSLASLLINRAFKTWLRIALIVSVPMITVFYAVHLLYPQLTLRKVLALGVVTYVSAVVFIVLTVALVGAYQEGLFILK